MTNEKLYEILGDINENHVKEAHMSKLRTKKSNWVKWGSMVACLCIIGMAVFTVSNSLTTASNQNQLIDMGGGESSPDDNPNDYSVVSGEHTSEARHDTSSSTIINAYKSNTSMSYASPLPGQYYCFVEVNEARKHYAGKNAAYLLTFDLFGADANEISEQEMNTEYDRLVNLGYHLYETEYWTYYGQGEKEYQTVIVGLFTEEELSNFDANPNYGYAFRFVTNGDGSGVNVNEDDLITDFASNYS